MNSRHLILALLFTLTAPLFARDQTDRLIMKNGDSMTCEIKGLDGGVLYVSFDYIDGTSSVDWSKVASVAKYTIVCCENGGWLGVHRRLEDCGDGRRQAGADPRRATSRPGPHSRAFT